MDTPLVAAVDIGTNSIHLLIARPIDPDGFDIVTTQKEVVRLGSGSGDMKLLADDAVDRGIAALVRMGELARSMNARIHAVATSAIREAENRSVFLERAATEAGIDVQVISGFEEARLIHLGMLRALPVFHLRMLGFDIGGGSTELVAGEGSTLLAARSFRLGAIRLTERFFPGGVVDDDEDVEHCRAFVQQTLAGIQIEFVGHQPEIMIGSSGTAAAITAMAVARRDEDPSNLNGAVVRRSELAGIVNELTALSPPKRAKLPGLDERRSDIIIGGAILAEQIVDLVGLDGFTYSAYALREGVLLDRLPGSAEHHLRDLRRSNVDRLARQLDPDVDHAEHCTALALALFDRLGGVHGYGSQERELLEMAGLLHNVGLFLSHSGHHKHSYYMIRHSEQLTGFTDNEIELIAQVARYHRKSHPTKKHDAFVALSKEDQRRVRVLAGILRIAIGLDRRHLSAVRSVGVVLGDRIEVHPIPADGEDLAVEVHAAEERLELLSEALGKAVSIVSPG